MIIYDGQSHSLKIETLPNLEHLLFIFTLLLLDLLFWFQPASVVYART
jgi:hypothetical protein